MAYRLAVAMVASLLCLAEVATAQCSTYTTQDTCFQAIQSSGTACVWDSTTCDDDTCSQHTTIATCQADANCVGTLLSNNGVECVNQQRICTALNVAQCSSFPYCVQTSDKSYCSYQVIGTGVPGSNSPVSCASAFPTWAIALVVVWVIILIILGMIVALTIKQSRNDAITAVEQSEVSIDSVQIRDNFQPSGKSNAGLERPLQS